MQGEGNHEKLNTFGAWYHLKNERTSRNNANTPRQKVPVYSRRTHKLWSRWIRRLNERMRSKLVRIAHVPASDGLKYGRLASTLPADDGDHRELKIET